MSDTSFKCTICGQSGTVGRCCGRYTREPLNDLARAEIERERKEFDHESLTAFDEIKELEELMKKLENNRLFTGKRK